METETTAAGKPCSILLVEDEKAPLKILLDVLSRKYPWCAILPAEDGRTALQLFKTHSPALVITDINMPDMNGLQMAAEMVALNPETRFVMITGNSASSPPPPEELRSTIRHYLVKPVNFEVLFNAIDQCLAESGEGRLP